MISEETMPELEDNTSDQSDGELTGDEDNCFDNDEPTLCLFCTKHLPSVDLAVAHLKNVHSVDLISLKTKLNMDQYSYIKMINFIRSTKAESDVINSVKVNNILWQNDKYLKPGDFEPWLTYDFENLAGTEQQLNLISNGIPSNDSEQYLKLEKLVHSLMEKIKEKDNLLEQACEDIKLMRAGFKRVVEKEPENQVTKPQCVANVSLKADEGYFSSYSHVGIHHEMLSDKVRTESYRDALLNNKDFILGKSVLDVGCGTSILSMFAAQAGAKEIIAIDNSDIIYNAMDIARQNKFDNIKFVKGRLEDTELPLDKFDIIISEWMGYFLVFEGMLDSIIYARDRHLKVGGTLMPNRCTISLVGYGDLKRHSELITFWDSVYELDMSALKKDVLHEPLIEICKPDLILTDSCVIVKYDLNKISLNYSNFQYDFEMRCQKDGVLTSFIGYFDTFFDLPNSVSFSTSADSTPTHWKQVVFFIETPIPVKKNELIHGKITCKRCNKDLRSLNIKINVFDKEYKYYLN